MPRAKEIWEQPVDSNDPIDILNIKLKRFKKYFKGWGSNISLVMREKEKNEIRRELEDIEKLEEEGPIDVEVCCRRASLLAELNIILTNEELFRLQQSRERWLLKGDQNTAYYHRIANGRKRKNTIHSFTDGDITIEGTKNLLTHAT